LITDLHYRGIMHKVVISADIDPLADNRKLAEENRAHLADHGVKAYDVLGSIGSGKTTLICMLAERLRTAGIRVGAIVGDVAGDDDHRRMEAAGIPSINVNTGKECHLDAHYIQHAVHKLPLDDLDLLFIENVGNLVCPADFPLGSEKRIVVISITEGDDMVRKHPVIFTETDMAVLNKVDLAPYMDASVDLVKEDYDRINPEGRIVLTSARTGEGIDELSALLTG
jgi:hydrogenase nickel incorporation protein HypB